MKIANQTSYNFTENRQKRESAREFVSNFMDAGLTDIVLQCAMEMNMSVEDATAYALAFFNSLQDLFYFHSNLSLPDVEIITTSTQCGIITGTRVRNKVYKLRSNLHEPYFTNRYIAQVKARAWLLREVVKVKKPTLIDKKKAEKKEKHDREMKRKRSERNNEKQRRYKKAIAKNWAWMVEP